MDSQNNNTVEMNKFIDEFKAKNREIFNIENGEEDHLLTANIEFWLLFLDDEKWKLRNNYGQSSMLLKHFEEIIKSYCEYLPTWGYDKITSIVTISMNDFIEYLPEKIDDHCIQLSEYNTESKTTVITGLIDSFKRAEGFFEWTDMLTEITKKPELKRSVSLETWLGWRIRARETNYNYDDSKIDEIISNTTNYYLMMGLNENDDENCMEPICLNRRDFRLKRYH